MFDEALAAHVRVTECCLAPVAETDTTAGEFEAVLATERLPVTLPAAAGSKITVKVVFCPAARLKGKAGPLTLNPAPVLMA
jgi:hypothetical protein